MKNLTRPDFSDFIVYVDESGDHSLTSIDKTYPVFVLALCVFHKQHYAYHVVPSMQDFKFRHFGHDCVILHEREIRKQQNDFAILNSKQYSNQFIGELSALMHQSNYILISCVIDKEKIKRQTAENSNPYHIGLKICIEQLYQLLIEKNQQQKITHIVVEKRGKKEDKELELEFRRICDGNNRFETNLPFEIRLIDKQANATGLQFADMVARPIGIHYLNPSQNNRAFGILKEKFYCKDGRKFVGENFADFGFNIFPKVWKIKPLKSEKPRRIPQDYNADRESPIHLPLL